MDDIVYFVKESPKNEELRYSLRSLVNFPHRKVIFYGGCPDGLKPDVHIKVVQDKEDKWANVNMMLRMACSNSDITPNFWLFNDDFFVMTKIDKPTNYYRGDLYKRIVQLEDKHNGFTPYSKLLRDCAIELENLGLETKDYSLHIPMQFNRDKAKELFNMSDFKGFRSLYGNYTNLANKQISDCKIVSLNKTWNGSCYLSTDEKSFEGVVGQQIKDTFPNRCKYERS